MLEVTPQGDQHPKDFVIKSDNANGEIDKIKEILKQAEVTAEEHLHQFFHGRPTEDFQQGVVLPATHAVDLADLTEGEPGLEPVADAVQTERENAMTSGEAGGTPGEPSDEGESPTPGADEPVGDETTPAGAEQGQSEGEQPQG